MNNRIVLNFICNFPSGYYYGPYIDFKIIKDNHFKIIENNLCNEKCRDTGRQILIKRYNHKANYYK